MTSFQDKERAEETKYALDQEQEFKAHARRNKLLGLWAAEKLGLKDNEALKYAKDVVISDFEEPGEEDVFRKVQADLKKANVSISDDEIRSKMSSLMKQAMEEIKEIG